MAVTMTCMTTKKKFEVESPEVVVLRNGRYAYRAECPWQGKNGRDLVAFKFCSRQAHLEYEKNAEQQDAAESEHSAPKGEQQDTAESEHSGSEGEHEDTAEKGPD